MSIGAFERVRGQIQPERRAKSAQPLEDLEVHRSGGRDLAALVVVARDRRLPLPPWATECCETHELAGVGALLTVLRLADLAHRVGERPVRDSEVERQPIVERADAGVAPGRQVRPERPIVTAAVVGQYEALLERRLVERRRRVGGVVVDESQLPDAYAPRQLTGVAVGDADDQALFEGRRLLQQELGEGRHRRSLVSGVEVPLAIHPLELDVRHLAVEVYGQRRVVAEVDGEGGQVSARWLDRDDIDQRFGVAEVVRVARVERQAGRECGCRDQEVERSRASRLPPGSGDRRVDPAVGARHVRVDRKRFEGGLRTLQTILSPGAFRGVRGRVRPAASSARVTAETASSPGRSPAETCSRSITTDVSMIPRGIGWSATRSGVVIERSVDIRPEPLGFNRGCPGERGDRGVGRHELARAQRDELADRHTVARDDERLAAVERAHDLTAAVAEFALRDLASHARECSTRATPLDRSREYRRDDPHMHRFDAHPQRACRGVLVQQPGRSPRVHCRGVPSDLRVGATIARWSSDGRRTPPLSPRVDSRARVRRVCLPLGNHLREVRRVAVAASMGLARAVLSRVVRRRRTAVRTGFQRRRPTLRADPRPDLSRVPLPGPRQYQAMAAPPPVAWIGAEPSRHRIESHVTQ